MSGHTKDDEDLISEIMEAYKERMRCGLDGSLGYLESSGGYAPESQIERVMLWALYWADIDYFRPGDRPMIVLSGSVIEDPDSHPACLYIIPQLKIGKYRADFAIYDHDCGTRLVVECDGHEFHERTKKQAQRDKKRDRDIQSLGWHVLRFTGSEIWADPVGCAQQVIDFLSNASDRRFPSQ